MSATHAHQTLDQHDFAPRVREDAVIPIPARVARACLAGAAADTAADSESAQWADAVAARIDGESCGVALRLGEHARSAEDARRLGHAIARAVRDALIRRGAPPTLDIEIDAPQSTTVSAGSNYRTLLPHHDGGNASYLTPSLDDDEEWNGDLRRTSPTSVTTTRRHKLYHGFILQHVGDAESVTTYYDLLTLVRLAHARQTGHSNASVPEIARWVGGNIQRATAAMSSAGGTCLTLGGMLGATRQSHVIVAVHHAEAALADDLLRRFPDLVDVAEPRGDGAGDGWGANERLFDRVLRETTGHGWRQIRQLAEVAVRGQAYDFILGHNITLLHGGWRGGRGRLIEPIYFVLDRPSGDAYERWLARAWRR